MPAKKTFGSLADKLKNAVDLIEADKTKRALTIIKKVIASCEKRSGDGDAPSSRVKRAPNKYMQFSMEVRPYIAKLNVGMKQPEILQEIGKKWQLVKAAGLDQTWKPGTGIALIEKLGKGRR